MPKATMSLRSDPPGARRARPARSRAVIPLLCLLSAGLCLCGLWYRQAWYQTQLTEAYLPDLEADFRRNPADGRLAAMFGMRLAQSQATSDKRKAREVASAAMTPRGEEGSFLDVVSEWWGRRHPEQSGFATRARWISAEPGNPEVQRLWGLALLRNRRPYDALGVLEGAVASAPDSAEMHRACALAYDGAGDSKRAFREAVKAILLDPDSVSCLVGFGQICLGVNTDYAHFAFRRASEIAPGAVEVWIGLGSADLQTAGGLRLSEAVKAFETARRLAPDRVDFLPDYALALSKSSRADEAETLMRYLITRSSGDAEAHYRLGQLLLQNDPTPARVAEAEADAREAVRLVPESPEYARGLGEALLGKGSAHDAIPFLRYALSRYHADTNTMRLLVRAYAQAGQPETAAAYAARAADLSTVIARIDVLQRQSERRYLEPDYHQELAGLYDRMGRSEGAASERRIRSILAADPGASAASYHAHQAEILRLLDVLQAKRV